MKLARGPGVSRKSGEVVGGEQWGALFPLLGTQLLAPQHDPPPPAALWHPNALRPQPGKHSRHILLVVKWPDPRIVKEILNIGT